MGATMSELNKKEFYYRPSFAYAGFFIRLVAFAIDMLVISAINRILQSVLNPNIELGLGISLASIIYWLISLGYFTLMTYFNNGQTLGKMITNIRVVSLNGEKADLWQIVSRETFGRYVQNKFVVLYLIIGFAPMKQSLADILSDTVVIRDNVNSYLLNKDKSNSENLEIVTN